MGTITERKRSEMKDFKKSDLVLLVLIVLSVIPGLMLYSQLPDQVPTHWGLHGEANGFGSKNLAIFLLPVINMGLFFLILFYPNIDPRRENFKKFAGSYTVLRWAVHLFFSAVYLFTLYKVLMYARGQEALNISGFITVAISLLIIVLGNYMGRVRHNYFVGIRTPWTLASEEVWQKTHRLGGKLYVASGVIGLLSVFLQDPGRFLGLLVPLIGANIFLAGYSYWQFEKIRGK